MTEFEKCLFWCDMICAKANETTAQLKQQRDYLQSFLDKKKVAKECDSLTTSEECD